ncbi:MAG TPA: carboxypeptidase-like regulatory domain-containing protein [Pyrinomonadaceae bacterium]|nr:carboxypeptidase-like regulatory domain-containing protein [Pyrinomonadaceae bacterium]
MQKLTLPIIFLFVCVAGAFAQNDPVIGDRKITGKIVDTKGLPIAGAYLIVTKNGVARSFASNTEGNFELRLKPGDFEVTVNRSNSKTFKLFLRVPEVDPSPDGLRIVLDPAFNCCVSDEGKTFPKPTSLPRPPYPPAARAVRASGEVEVVVKLATDGSVESAEARSGHPLLRAAATAAARKSKFEPPDANESSTLILVYVFLPYDDKESTIVRYKNPFRIEIFGEDVVINASMARH